ncbi:hypothetical protein B0O99DRAFT_237570 [Bisporella sp. PMI_857]|nr:hypothetical protein B0O99DRAFT_237570 [Bisporella sp. PMI_857]
MKALILSHRALRSTCPGELLLCTHVFGPSLARSVGIDPLQTPEIQPSWFFRMAHGCPDNVKCGPIAGEAHISHGAARPSNLVQAL